MRLSLVGAALTLTAAISLSGGAPARAQGTLHADRAKHAAGAGGAGGEAKADAIANAVFDHLIDVSDMHWHKGEYNHIINLSRMIVGAMPHEVAVYANAGWLLWSLNRDDEAVACYRQGIEANPKSYYMYDEMGQYYYNRKKDWNRAVRYYELAAALRDCPANTVHMLAHAYEKNGQLSKALAAWKRAVNMKGDLIGSAQINLRRVQGLVERQDRSR